MQATAYAVFCIATLLLSLPSCKNGEGDGQDADAGDQRYEDQDWDEVAQDEDGALEVEWDADLRGEESGEGNEEIDAGDLEEAEGGEEPLAAVADYCGQLADGFCRYLTTCCTVGEQSRISGLIDCAAPRSSAYYANCYTALSPIVEDGSAEIYVAAIAGCVAIFDDMASSCPNYNSAPIWKQWYVDLGCSEAVRGLLSPNEGCYSSEQCAGSYFCDRSVDPWVCAPRAATGGPCTVNEGCLVGDVCVQGACKARSGSGEPCDDDGDCNFGYWCDMANGGICTDMLPPDVTCDPSHDVCAGRCDPTATVCVFFCDGVA